MNSKDTDASSRGGVCGQRLTQLVRRIPPWGEFAIVIGICWGWPVSSSVALMMGLKAEAVIDDPYLLYVIAFEVAVGGVAYWFLRLRGWSYRRFLPDINWTSSGAGILLFLLSYLLHWAAIDIGRFVFGGSVEPLDELYRSTSVSLSVAIAGSVVNGVFEESVLVAYLFRSLERQGTAFIVGISALLRVLAHVYQGPVGSLSVLVLGLFFGFVYARYRQLWALMFAHILADALYLAR
jgi:membrane protease YdiL (CAAX protease family)